MNGVLLVAFYVACIAAWFTHIIACVEKDLVFLLFCGIFIFPIGVAHGFLVWLGLA